MEAATARLYATASNLAALNTIALAGIGALIAWLAASFLRLR
jgi:hypothetical protein